MQKRMKMIVINHIQRLTVFIYIKITFHFNHFSMGLSGSINLYFVC